MGNFSKGAFNEIWWVYVLLKLVKNMLGNDIAPTGNYLTLIDEAII